MKTFSPEATPINVSALLDDMPPSVRKELEGLAAAKGVTIETFLRDEPAADYEDILEIVLRALPHEIFARKLAEHEKKGSSLETVLRDSMDTLRQRQTMWKYEGKEGFEEETLKTIQVFNGAKYQQELFEGKGNAGYVFQVPEVPSVCIKFLHTPALQRYSPEREFGILDTVNQSADQFEELKVPVAHGVAVNIEASKSFFTMETIDGLTLLQLTESATERVKFCERAGFSESYLVALLEDKKRIAAMCRDLNRIHKSGILHGDIHQRNIMINTKGEFYLIDFGNALIETDLPVDMDYETVENRKELDLKTFENCFTTTSLNLRKREENHI